MLQERNGKTWLKVAVAGVLAASGVANATVLINEFVVTPTSEEMIELCNTSSETIEVGGWTVEWSSGSTTINAGESIPAGGYLVLDDGNTGDISLSNSGTVLTIKDANGTVIDRVGYGSKGGAPKPEYRFSTARTDDCRSSGDDAADFNIDPTPTRGSANDVPASALGTGGVVINEIDARSGEAFIELYNTGSTELNISGWHLSVDDTYDMPDNSFIPAHGFWVLEENDFPTYFYMGENGDNVYLFNRERERVDQVGWDSAASAGSWNRMPDGKGANDGWNETNVPLYDRNTTKGRLNDIAPALVPAVTYILE